MMQLLITPIYLVQTVWCLRMRKRERVRQSSIKTPQRSNIIVNQIAFDIFMYLLLYNHTVTHEYYLIHVAKYIGRCTHSTVVRVYK